MKETKDIADCQEHINDLKKEEKEYLANLELQEKTRREKEILAKEIKEWQERQENYSNPKLLPSLPKNQT